MPEDRCEPLPCGLPIAGDCDQGAAARRSSTRVSAFATASAVGEGSSAGFRGPRRSGEMAGEEQLCRRHSPALPRLLLVISLNQETGHYCEEAKPTKP